MTRHHIRVYRDRNTHIRPWRWTCICNTWQPWAWHFHWTHPDALTSARDHLTNPNLVRAPR